MEVVLLALVAVAGLGWQLYRVSLRAQAAEVRAERAAAMEADVTRLRVENADLRERAAAMEARAEAERASHAERVRLLEDARTRLTDSFQAISAEALRSNNQAFLQAAAETLRRFTDGAQTDLTHRQAAIEELVKPLKDSLHKVDARIGELEIARASAYSGLTEQVKSLSLTQAQLQGQTANLVKALRAPQTRGRWGEMQLQRVVELAGMVEHCDFRQQQTLYGEEGRLRPDLVVHLPGGRRIVVDAKAPLSAYLDGVEAQDEAARRAALRNHATQVRTHIEKLAARSYWQQFSPAPEFVVLFLPGESIFSAALECDGELIEYGVSQRVLAATPTTLIALLLTVAHGWRQEKIAQNALEISALGKEIYDRLRGLGGHFSKVGESLGRAVEHYNRAAGTLESRVLVSARRMRDHGVTAVEEIVAVEPVEKTARALQAGELLSLPEEFGAGQGQPQ